MKKSGMPEVIGYSSIFRKIITPLVPTDVNRFNITVGIEQAESISIDNELYTCTIHRYYDMSLLSPFSINSRIYSFTSMI